MDLGNEEQDETKVTRKCRRRMQREASTLQSAGSGKRMDEHLPLNKIRFTPPASSELPPAVSARRSCLILVATGSFNPPTYMHLRMFELARDSMNLNGYHVIGCYMSPVNDAYKKKGLVSAKHRLLMCGLCCDCSQYVMVDSWEANQTTYQHTLTVLERIKRVVCRRLVTEEECLSVMLLCGSDLLESFNRPGVWIREHVKRLCEEFGIVCVRREGQDVEKIISVDGILNENRCNIKIVEEPVENRVSSSLVRECISRKISVKYVVPDEVIDYIKQQHLYT